ncbi:MAG TPA: hypothetical protein VKV15_14115 [Bryobacteraceae bacterium]|nr:hypothetical protein [Bryobacteraceae bacterium]
MAEKRSSSRLSHTLEPLCTRHDHVLAYDGDGISWRDGPDRHSPLQTVDSYHCGYFGCSVRYRPNEGYFTVVDTPDRPHFIEEPGANVFRCPHHGTWMYRSREQDGSRWRCGVEGCDYYHDEKLAIGMTG